MVRTTLIQAFIGLTLAAYAHGQGCANDPCGADQTCVDDAGSALCLDAGYRQGNCSYNIQQCHELASCQETADHKAFTCVCIDEAHGDGFLDGTGCSLPYKVCSKTSECPQFAECDTEALHCRCKSGFDGSGFECHDVNECEVTPDICGANKICTNTPGSYECKCNGNENYVDDGQGGCKLLCLSHSNCDFPRARCNEENTCECIAGYTGDGRECRDVNECLTGEVLDCHENAECHNTEGSYECVCKNGHTGDGKNCAPLPTRCIEVEGRRNKRFYLIDPDGEGPANAFTVQCFYIENKHWATAIVPEGNFPMQAPEIDVPLEIQYEPSPEDIQALIDNSAYCSQKFTFTCSSGFAMFPGTTWYDGSGVGHNNWGSDQDNMCQCGELLRCPNNCHCDGTQVDETTMDKAHIVDKNQLPLTSISFTQAQADKGRVDVEALMCSDKPFHMPVDCHEAKFEYGVIEDSAQMIDTDGEGGEPPFLVWCDMESLEHVGITEIPPSTGTTVTVTTAEGEPITYPLAHGKISALIGISFFCSQVVAFECQNSKLLGADGGALYVTEQERRLNSFAGANGKPDSCACGATQSCDSPEVSCNCNIEDGDEHMDFGIIIDKTDLPVTKVTAQVGGGSKSVYHLSKLRCSQKQFAIEPNCEKYRSLAVNVTGTYYIDSDGSGGLPPFPVECVFVESPPQGKTVVHHDNEGEIVVDTGILPINYLMASPEQIDGLLKRSTFCTQQVSVGCQSFSVPSGTILWTGQGEGPAGTHKLADFLDSCGPDNDACQCESGTGRDNGTVIDKEILPINSFDLSGLDFANGQTLTMNVGPLICSEVFPTCKQLHEFVESGMAVEGEATVVNGFFTADPDGPGGVPPFEVECLFPSTIVEVDRTKGKIGPSPEDRLEPHVKCFDIGYSTKSGVPVTSAQAAALVKSADACEQDLSLECTNAPATGMINFTTCDGRVQQGWSGSYGADSCACGVNGNCEGGPDAKCNCDIVDGKARKDQGTIHLKDRLPICQICMRIEPPADGSGWPAPPPSLRFRISKLTCDYKPKTYGSCQESRRGFNMKSRNEEHMMPMVGNPPVPIGCVLQRDPPTGVITVKPKKPVTPPSPEEPTDIKVNYITINITLVGQVMSTQEFCSQKIFLFCAGEEAGQLGGDYAWYGRDMETPHYDWKPLPEDGDDVDRACDEHQEYCESCGKPMGFYIGGEHDLPLTRLVVAGSNMAVVIEPAECFDVLGSCQEIYDKDQRQTGYFGRSRYVIDPDREGPLRPFRVYCEFSKSYQNGVTVVEVGGEWSSSQPAKNNEEENENNLLPVEYDYAGYDQINALAQVSNFCWQGVRFACKGAKLLVDPVHPSSYLTLFDKQPASSFGTDLETDFKGCACHKLGFCSSALFCNCDEEDSDGVDQGAITDLNALPVTGVYIANINDTDNNADIVVTDVRCSGKSSALPRDCAQAFEWQQRDGVTFLKTGEFLISPQPGEVEPFMVRCDFDTYPGIGVTVVKPHWPHNRPLTPAEPNTTYEIPYMGVSEDQLAALVSRSYYCYQGVKFDCSMTALLSGGAYFTNTNRSQPWKIWGGGRHRGWENIGLCACGNDEACGGLDSSEGQRTRPCNCDIVDEKHRSDAGVIDRKIQLPIVTFHLGEVYAASQANLTIGDLICTRDRININECDESFPLHDCDERAECHDLQDGYHCVCPKGFQGKGVIFDSSQALANGRECIDDNECIASSPCPYSAICHNTEGSYYCECMAGYKQVGEAECEDIDECAEEGLSDCDENARCENQIGSYRCICNKGYRGDGKVCIPVGQCSCFGDPHCLSFDNKWLHYQGDCHYTMATDGCNGRDPTFTVNVELWKRDQDPLSFPFSWVKSATVLLEEHTVRLEQGPKLVVNGEVHTQYIDSFKLRAVVMNKRVQLKTLQGLELTWDGIDRLSLTVPKDSKNMTCGLCGNYDGDPENDWTVGPACPAEAGQITENFDKFGRSWTLTDKCEVDCSDTQPTDPEECVYGDIDKVKEECTKLINTQSSAFKVCLETKSDTDMEQLMYSCTFDLCASSDDMNDKICRVAETLAKDCSETDRVEVPDWRAKVDACEEITCPNNQIYMSCGPANPETCTSGTESEAGLGQDNSCVEGCFCPPGLLLEGIRCIKPLWCGCFHDHGYIATGERVILRDCSAEVLCLGKNETESKPVECPEGMECRIEDGTAGCYCLPEFQTIRGTCVLDACQEVTCAENQECVNGTCICKTGYDTHCGEDCIDINECETGENTCHGYGQQCTNLPGSYRCDCKPGFVKEGGACVDANECVLDTHNCGDNSRCVNTVGSYICECCAGFTMGPGDTCVPNPEEESAGDRCCFCNSPKCPQPGKVCGTDGTTYDSFRALSKYACVNDLSKEDLMVNYKGTCKNSCDSVICEQQYAECKNDDQGVPQCCCPECDGENDEYAPVCGTDGETYSSVCNLKRAACVSPVPMKLGVEAEGACPGDEERKR